jgi:hypothetical protein
VTDNPRTDTNVTADVDVEAIFEVEPCSVPKLINDINLANADGDLTIITLEAGCVYLINEPITDPTYGEVGLPVITTPIKLVSVGTPATIAYGSDTSFPLIVVSPDGELTLKNVIIGGSNAQAVNRLQQLNALKPFTQSLDLNKELTYSNVVFGNLDDLDLQANPALSSLGFLNIEASPVPTFPVVRTEQ